MITSGELARRAGISVRHLNYLVAQGLAAPSVPSRKKGSPAQWSEDDVRAVAQMVRARRALDQLGRGRVPPVRLRALDTRTIAVAVGGIVVSVRPSTTIARLLRTLGGAFAVIADPDPDPKP